MKLLNSVNISFFIGLVSIFFFTGCSSKNVDNDYNKFYKNTNNSKINNSPEMHRATMRPYSVFGIKYYPEIAKIGDRFEGIASWYGPDFHSKKTSNGEIYNMYDMTAAHKTLPMNTVVRVDNLENGKSTIVRINDRGPFVSGRIIDLSNKAAHAISMVGAGTAKVKVTVLGYNGEIENSKAPALEVIDTPKEEKIEPFEAIEIKEDNIVVTTPVSTQIGAKVANNKSSNQKIVGNSKVAIQVGAFSKLEGANKVKKDYQNKYPSKIVEYVNQNGLYKVLIKGFSSEQDAVNFRSTNGLNNAVIIK
ncbi:septal ring lytic transglycosylase [Aliarcobacter cibarius]|uniref:septal ring lytic transglycosylase RlpA family protein n=1 Tax=Aliarcobacter cibarius TaxID=255507 RepID=UPI001245CFFE|nr:septal ring lytic transglycosylase RlpA family protein [Aliarcobacter cibarius]QEZ89417.1 septal ring lytic transglycosylase [Aliarcobacter cibarius]